MGFDWLDSRWVFLPSLLFGLKAFGDSLPEGGNKGTNASFLGCYTVFRSAPIHQCLLVCMVPSLCFS